MISLRRSFCFFEIHSCFSSFPGRARDRLTTIKEQLSGKRFRKHYWKDNRIEEVAGHQRLAWGKGNHPTPYAQWFAKRSYWVSNSYHREWEGHWGYRSPSQTWIYLWSSLCRPRSRCVFVASGQCFHPYFFPRLMMEGGAGEYVPRPSCPIPSNRH